MCLAKASAYVLLLSGFSFPLTAFASTPTVRINEVMASNGSTLADEDGDYEDWIELYNYGDAPVDLSGWGLSDSYSNPFKWTFPESTSIGAGEYLLVWASGKDRNEDVPIQLGAPFNSTNEDRQFADLVPEGTTGFTAAYDPNNSTNRAGWTIPPLPPERTVRVEALINTGGVNVVLSVTSGGGMGSFGTSAVGISTPDLTPHVLEITNQTAVDRDILSFVTTSPLADEMLIVEEIRVFLMREAEDLLHTNFSISAVGEEVLLTMPDGTLVDELEPTLIPRDVSIGRVDGEGNAWFFFDEPTPGGANDTTAYLGILDPPVFSRAPGFYSSPFSLAIEAIDDSVIYFTLDGSEPDPLDLNGAIYQYKNQYPREPNDEFGPLSERIVQSFIYEDVIPIDDLSASDDLISSINKRFTQSMSYPLGKVFRGSVVRAIAVKEGYLPSSITTGTFLVHPGIQSRYDLMVVSISTDERSLFDYETGIAVPGKIADQWRINNPGANFSNSATDANYHQRGFEWERPAHVEFFSSHGERLFSQRLGIRIHGGASRAFASRKSFRFYPRNDYDFSDSINFPVFDELMDRGTETVPVNSFRRVILRNAGNDYAGNLYRDALLQSLVEHLGVGQQAYRPVVHFVNGEFWGIMNFRERFDEHYLQAHYGVDPDDAVLLWRNASIDHGIPQDRQDFWDMRNFARDNDMSDDLYFNVIKEQMDIENFARYFALQVYINNTDWPNNNINFWRKRTDSLKEEDSYGHDGKYRWLIADLDRAMINAGQASQNAIDRISSSGIGHPPDWSTELFRALIENKGFRSCFINLLGDMANYTFDPIRVAQKVESFNDFLAHSRPEHVARWNSGEETGEGIVDFANARPQLLRQHVIEHYLLSGLADLTLRNHSDGSVRLNSLVFGTGTPGLPDPANPYPWTGTYFQGVPVELEALPEPGHRFVGWLVSATEGVEPQGEAAFYSTEALISLDLSEDTTVEAVFEPVPLAEQPVALHVWDFEDADNLLVPTSVVAGGALEIDPGLHPDWEAIANTGGDFNTQHLRVNYPLGSTLTFALPTTGYEAITLDFLTRRSGQGAGEMYVEYTTDGSTWTTALEDPDFLTLFNAPPQAHGFDFSETAGAADNADFAVRFTFAQGEGGEAGNNRFDDVVLSGVALPATNLPPVVDAEAVPELVPLVSGAAAWTADLGDWFTDPEGDAMVFSAESSAPGVVSAAVDGAQLALTPFSAGEAALTVWADDGENPPVAAELRVLVYGAAHAVAAGPYTFAFWSVDEPAGSFPPGMLFVQSAEDDPDAEADLLHAYSIAGDAHADDDAAFPYAAERRTRLNGLGEDGISFINTGRGRDLGGAVLTLDTTGAHGIDVGFTAGTVQPNDRVYALRLQYRLAAEGPWTDAEAGGQAVVYSSAGRAAGHTQPFGPVRLPEALEDQPLVQLQWRYHHVSGTSGSRAQLRLGDVVVTTEGLPQITVLHAWDFEDLDEEALLLPSFTVGGGTLAIDPGPDTEVISNTGGDFATRHLRVNDPLGAALTLALPTTGYEAVSLSFLTRRSGSGAGLMGVEYTTNGSDWEAAEESPLTILNEPPQAFALDFGAVPEAADNPAFAVRFTFAQGDGGDEGNNRFDDIIVRGVPLPGTNLPPVVNEGAMPATLAGTAGAGAFVVDVSDWFSDPEGDSLTYTASTVAPGVVAASADGASVWLTPLQAGGAVLTVSAMDGHNPPVEASLYVLVYPAPHALAGSAYTFNAWSAEAPAGAYPVNMVFLQSGTDDPDLETDLPFAYSIAGDAHADDDADFPYAAERRTRINGLGEDGISFINTGRGRDLGAALLALDTTGRENIRVTWTGGTVLRNDRVYAIRLQSRIGDTGPWEDVLREDPENGPSPVEYVRAETEGHSAVLGPVTLPAALEDRPLVQLQWRYHHIGVDSGPRAMLRLDDILVESAAAGFASWAAESYPGETDPAVTGPMADPSGHGLPNLLRYALGLAAGEPLPPGLVDYGPGPEMTFALTFPRDPAKTDIAYIVEASGDLLDWTEVLYDSRTDPAPNTHGDKMRVADPAALQTGSPRFLRLRVDVVQ
ncbi:MAG: CotH kinase family protein [Opitutales bacterium]|nr:CotH kinase family protein [Opitutales bacterium]